MTGARALSFFVLSGALFSALFVACSGEKQEELPPDQPGVTLASLCTELATADCDRLENCGLLAPPLDRDRCLLRQKELRCEPYRAAIQRAGDAGELTFFELSARVCRDHVRALGCEVGFDEDYFGDAECRAIAGGQKGEGGSCSLPLACVDGTYCRAGADCPGTCQPFRQNNETCTAMDRCAPDFFCVTPGMRCRARVALNAPCEISVSGNSCADGGFCDASQPGGAHCVPVRGRGAGCRSSFECAPDLTCISNLCSGGLERDTCRTDGDCRGLLKCGGGRCSKPHAEGEVCDSGASPCGEGLVCTSSAGARRCVVEPVLGEVCSATMPCYLSKCAGGMCAPATSDETTCTTAAECLPGRACTEARCTLVEPACAE